MLISAIMPTRNRDRAHLVQQAVECFAAQTWPDRELVIVDDADAPSFATPPRLPGVEYHLSPRRLSIGAKRNLACSRAAGDVIMHWDDDDYSAPDRMRDQVERLTASVGFGIGGYHSMLFEWPDGARRRFTREPAYALGTSLIYTREFWRAHPFADKNKGEDNDMVHAARGRIATADAGELLIARVHGANTSGAYRDIQEGEVWSRVA